MEQDKNKMEQDESKMVEMPLGDIMELVNALKKCKKDKEILQETVDKLNAEIREYNKNFTSNDR
jgi:uncharacterized protein (UPF0305 family)